MQGGWLSLDFLTEPEFMMFTQEPDGIGTEEAGLGMKPD